MQLNLEASNVIPMVIWFVVLVSLHILLVMWRNNTKKNLDAISTDTEQYLEAKLLYKKAYWICKIYPFAAVLGILIGFA